VSKAVHAVGGMQGRHSTCTCDQWFTRRRIARGGVHERGCGNTGLRQRIPAGSAAALKKDIRNILNLTKNSVESAELMKRTRAMIEKQLGDYFIFEIDKNPVGCVALHVTKATGKPSWRASM